MQEAIEAFSELTKVESTYITRRVQADVTAAVNDCVRRGTLNGSAARSMIFKEATRAIPIEAQMAMNTLLRCLTAHGDAVRPDNAQMVKDALNSYIRTRHAAIAQMAMASAPMKGVPYPSTHSREFDETADTEIARINTEVDLIAASYREKDTSTASGPSIVINAPVGVIQTGAGSYGNATQFIDSSTRESLRSGLAKVEELLASDTSAESQQLLELVKTARAEAEKDNPNPHVLKSLVQGVGSAIATIPKLREGYENIKWALSFVGVTLP